MIETVPKPHKLDLYIYAILNPKGKTKEMINKDRSQKIKNINSNPISVLSTFGSENELDFTSGPSSDQNTEKFQQEPDPDTKPNHLDPNEREYEIERERRAELPPVVEERTSAVVHTQPTKDPALSSLPFVFLLFPLSPSPSPSRSPLS